MSAQTKGVVGLLYMAFGCLVVALLLESTPGVFIFSYILVGQLSMWLAVWLVQRHERKYDSKPNKH